MSVSGVECGGAGQACATGGMGICATGVTSCDSGTLRCAPLGAGEPERCDGLDNDCNGVVDDGATCDNPQEICVNGECVPRCTLGQEFGCTEDTQCDQQAGVCIDPKCKGITCPPDQICRAGVCGGACDGIVCPHGITCRDGACVDPCAGKSVRRRARSAWAASACPAATPAAASPARRRFRATRGPARASIRPARTAARAGQYCDAGSCKDACDGAVCPPKHQCVMGQCVPSSTPNGTGGGDGTGGGGSGGADGGVGGNGATGAGGCGCAEPARPRGGTSGAFFVAILFGLGARRLRHMM